MCCSELLGAALHALALVCASFRSLSKPSQGALGAILDFSCTSLGTSWASLGLVWASLGTSWPILGDISPVLDLSWATLGSSSKAGGLLELLWGPFQDLFGIDFETAFGNFQLPFLSVCSLTEQALSTYSNFCLRQAASSAAIICNVWQRLRLNVSMYV